MKKLNEDEQVKVEIAKEAIIQLREAQDIIYANLVEEVGVDTEWLFDYIYNINSADGEEFTSFVKSKLFK